MLLGADDLEQVRTQPIRRLVIVQGAIDANLGESAGEGKPDSAPARERRARKPAARTEKPKTSKRASRPGTHLAPAGA
jgi:hypothetical protein